MQKIFIVGVQDWTTQDRKTGKQIEGMSYIGYLPEGKALKFTSREQYVVHTGEVAYDAEKAIEIPLLTKLFEGKVSYQDGNSFGKKVVVQDN